MHLLWCIEYLAEPDPFLSAKTCNTSDSEAHSEAGSDSEAHGKAGAQ